MSSFMERKIRIPKLTKCKSCNYEAVTWHPEEIILPCRKCLGKLEVIAEGLI